MGLFKSFSERERERLGNATDVFEYDSVPEKLRNQIIRIWEKFFGEAWAAPIKKIGSGFIFTLRSSRWLDTAEAIDDLNTRLRQYSLGYELVFSDEPSPFWVRKDNEHVHRDIVIPALILLREHAFKGANDEYRTAHRHYLAGNDRECLISCLQAFESTMKTICVQRKWHFNPTDTAKPLIKVCLDKGLLKSFLESHMTPVRCALEGSIPTMRNNLAGRGQGVEIKEVRPFYAQYLLHQTAVTIVLLVEGFKALPPLSFSQ